jgi:hypothetical protein
VWQMSERQTALRRLQQVSNLLLFCQWTVFNSNNIYPCFRVPLMEEL